MICEDCKFWRGEIKRGRCIHTWLKSYDGNQMEIDNKCGVKVSNVEMVNGLFNVNKD